VHSSRVEVDDVQHVARLQADPRVLVGGGVVQGLPLAFACSFYATGPSCRYADIRLRWISDHPARQLPSLAHYESGELSVVPAAQEQSPGVAAPDVHQFEVGAKIVVGEQPPGVAGEGWCDHEPKLVD
jgi:hypothetical protein